MTGSSGNSEFCFPWPLSVPLGSGNIGGLRETKPTVSLGASHKVLIVNRHATLCDMCGI